MNNDFMRIKSFRVAETDKPIKALSKKLIFKYIDGKKGYSQNLHAMDSILMSLSDALLQDYKGVYIPLSISEYKPGGYCFERKFMLGTIRLVLRILKKEGIIEFIKDDKDDFSSARINLSRKGKKVVDFSF